MAMFRCGGGGGAKPMTFTQKITYSYFFLPAIIGLICMLPCLITYFKEDMTVKQIYPVEEAQHVRINPDHTITVEYEQPVMARVFEVTI